MSKFAENAQVIILYMEWIYTFEITAIYPICHWVNRAGRRVGVFAPHCKYLPPKMTYGTWWRISAKWTGTSLAYMISWIPWVKHVLVHISRLTFLRFIDHIHPVVVLLWPEFNWRPSARFQDIHISCRMSSKQQNNAIKAASHGGHGVSNIS